MYYYRNINKIILAFYFNLSTAQLSTRRTATKEASYVHSKENWTQTLCIEPLYFSVYFVYVKA